MNCCRRTPHVNRRAALYAFGSAAAALALPLPAWSQSGKILLGYTAVTQISCTLANAIY